MSDDVNDALNVTESRREVHTSSDDFWAFRKMITPILIQILFWIGVIVCILGGIMMVARAHNEYRDTWDGAQVALGLASIFLGPVVVRLYCEFLILFFRMNETLTEIRNKLKS